VFVLGGREAQANSQTRTMLAITPDGTLGVAGMLPLALSDLSAVTVGERIVIAGGRDAGGRVHDAILTITLEPGGRRG
jgi:hypothetical protein